MTRDWGQSFVLVVIAAVVTYHISHGKPLAERIRDEIGQLRVMKFSLRVQTLLYEGEIFLELGFPYRGIRHGSLPNHP